VIGWKIVNKFHDLFVTKLARGVDHSERPHTFGDMDAIFHLSNIRDIRSDDHVRSEDLSIREYYDWVGTADANSGGSGRGIQQGYDKEQQHACSADQPMAGEVGCSSVEHNNSLLNNDLCNCIVQENSALRNTFLTTNL
jgi:hypothetical protein